MRETAVADMAVATRLVGCVGRDVSDWVVPVYVAYMDILVALPLRGVKVDGRLEGVPFIHCVCLVVPVVYLKLLYEPDEADVV